MKEITSVEADRQIVEVALRLKGHLSNLLGQRKTNHHIQELRSCCNSMYNLIDEVVTILDTEEKE